MKIHKRLFAATAWLTRPCTALIFLFASVRVSENSLATTGEFRTLAENYNEEFLQLNPFYATMMGDNRYNHLLPLDIGEEHRAKQKALFEKYLTATAKLDRRKLAADDQISYDMFMRQLAMSIEGFEFPDHLIPINHQNCLPVDFDQIGSGASIQPFNTVKDYNDFLARTDGFVAWIDLAVTNMKKGLELDVTQPGNIIELSLPLWEAQMVDDVEKSLFYQPIVILPNNFAEEFRAKTFPGGAYVPAAADGSRPGVFYVNTSWPSYPRHIMMALFLHEALPGHHMQIAVSQEQENLPRLRRFGYYGAYTEGWGLYCESLGKEMGLYDDLYQYLGALMFDLGRACRLVGDVGIHHKGWTKGEAIKFLTENTHGFGIGENDRFTAAPGQALSYKIGQLKLLELRRRAEKKLGAKFDVREFHDRILLNGAMPLEVLENNIDKWITQR